MAELAKTLNLTDQRLSQAISIEVGEEANLRLDLAREVMALKETVFQLKTNVTEEVRKLQELVASANAKLYQEVSEAKGMIASEKHNREQGILQAKAEYSQNSKEVMERSDARCDELHRETRAGLSQMTMLLDQVRANLARDLIKAQQSFLQTNETFEESRNEQVLEAKKFRNEMSGQLKNLIKTYDSKIADVRTEVKLAEAARLSSFAELHDKIAEDNLRREKDEGAILSMLEMIITQGREAR